MDKDRFDKIQELVSSIIALHPVIAVDNKKEERLYMALHDLNSEMERSGCNKFKLTS